MNTGKKRAAQGQGTLRKKTVKSNGKEYITWEGRITIDGVQRSVSAKTQAECVQKMKDLQRKVDDGTYAPPSKLTVAQWLEQWITNYCTDVKPRTRIEYESIIGNHLKPVFLKNGVKLQKLTKKEVQDIINSIAKQTSKRTGKPLSAKTIKCIFGVLHSALECAVELEQITRNPADRVKLPVMAKKEVRPLTNEEITSFVDEIKTHRFKDLYLVDLFTGMRESEICGLSWDAVDFQEGTITIKQQIQRRKDTGGKYEIVPTKNGKTRKIRPAPFVMEILKEHKRKQWKEMVKKGDNWKNKNNLVFTDNEGKNYCPHVVYENFKRIATSIGRPDAKFHTLRHTFATTALSQGDDLKSVQEALGHFSAAFTADTYGHVSRDMQKASAERMENYAVVMGIA